MFPSCRKSSRTATRFTMFVRFLEIQKRSHFRTIALLFKFSFSAPYFPKAIQPQGAGCHHDGAATGKLGTKQSSRTKEEIESLPDSISSRPNAAAIVSGHCPQTQGASRHHDGAATGKLGTKQPPRTKEEIESLPDSISMRPNAAAIVSGGTPPKRGSRCQRAPPARKRGDRVG